MTDALEGGVNGKRGREKRFQMISRRGIKNTWRPRDWQRIEVGGEQL